jgi:hypothetical protein
VVAVVLLQVAEVVEQQAQDVAVLLAVEEEMVRLD